MNLSPARPRTGQIARKISARKNIDAIYASPMKRVQQTLAPFLKNGAPAQTILPGLREIDFGDWTGLNWEEVREKFGIHPTNGWTKSNAVVPNGESGPQFRRRVEPCLREIIRRHPGETVGIFCHGGVIRMMLRHPARTAAAEDQFLRDRIHQRHAGRAASAPERNRTAQFHAVARFACMKLWRGGGRKTGAHKAPATAKSFLDIGTGSGILAIAAAKLGYSPVHAFDFDAEAVRVARANGRANRSRQS
jgi:hypothetical protein